MTILNQGKKIDDPEFSTPLFSIASANPPQPLVQCFPLSSAEINAPRPTSGDADFCLPAADRRKGACIKRCFKRIFEILACTESRKGNNLEANLKSIKFQQICSARNIAVLATLLLVTTASLVGLMIFANQDTGKHATPLISVETKPPKKQCNQIGTNEACNQNEKCKWIANKSSCIEDFIPSFQLEDTVIQGPRPNISEVDSEWRPIDQDEEIMKEAISKYGPIVASIAVDKQLFAYKSGVFTAPTKAKPNHAVLIVGYGQQNGYDVWFIKNSWGKNWGEQGFMSIRRNVNLRGTT